MALPKEVKQLFTHMVKDAGMPVDETAMRAEWERLNEAEDSLIRNNSSFSPFWRLITAIATKPCKWLVNVLVEHALPNTFVRFASGIYLDVMCWGVDVARKGVVHAQGKIAFYKQGAGGDTIIPAGLVISTPPINGTMYSVVTTEESIITNGQAVGYIPVKAEKAGQAWNLGAGYYSILEKNINGITAVKNEADWLEIPGADEEEDQALRLRYRNQFAAVGQLHHDAAYKVLIASFAGIRMDYIYFEKDGPRGPGTANGYIMLETGVPPQAFCDAINDYIMTTGNHGHGDDLVCMPMKTIPLDLRVTVHAVSGAGDERKMALLEEVTNRIRCVFRENTDYTMTKTYPLSRFSFSRLSDELHDALVDLKSVEFHRGEDIVSTLELPVLKSLTVKGGWEDA